MAVGQLRAASAFTLEPRLSGASCLLLDELTWRWFQCVRAKNTPISGPLIQEQARVYAEQLHKQDFKAPAERGLEMVLSHAKATHKNVHLAVMA